MMAESSTSASARPTLHPHPHTMEDHDVDIEMHEHVEDHHAHFHAEHFHDDRDHFHTEHGLPYADDHSDPDIHPYEDAYPPYPSSYDESYALAASHLANMTAEHYPPFLLHSQHPHPDQAQADHGIPPPQAQDSTSLLRPPLRHSLSQASMTSSLYPQPPSSRAHSPFDDEQDMGTVSDSSSTTSLSQSLPKEGGFVIGDRDKGKGKARETPVVVKAWRSEV